MLTTLMATARRRPMKGSPGGVLATLMPRTHRGKASAERGRCAALEMSIGASAGREEGRERDEASENARQGGDVLCPAVSRGGVSPYMLTTFTRPCRLDGTSPRGCH